MREEKPLNFKWHNVVVLEDVVVICKGYYCYLLSWPHSPGTTGGTG